MDNGSARKRLMPGALPKKSPTGASTAGRSFPSQQISSTMRRSVSSDWSESEAGSNMR